VAYARKRSSAQSASFPCGPLSLLLSFSGSWDRGCALCFIDHYLAPREGSLLSSSLQQSLIRSLSLPHQFPRLCVAMAGATKISIRTVAALAAASVAFGVWRVNLKSLVLKTVTGPGNVSRIIALVVALANLKNLPFVWHVCPLCPLCWRFPKAA
jgi:hypothetical protein